jgi:hypothetical protein
MGKVVSLSAVSRPLRYYGIIVKSQALPLLQAGIVIWPASNPATTGQRSGKSSHLETIS